MSVLSVMRSLRSEVDAGKIRPYCFVEINGLKLASPENIYRVKLMKSILFLPLYDYVLGYLIALIFFQVIYEALNGHRVSWKKALHLLNERFVEGKKTREEADRPCILLIDELDLLVTRNQSVTYKSCNKKLFIGPTFFDLWNYITMNLPFITGIVQYS